MRTRSNNLTCTGGIRERERDKTGVLLKAKRVEDGKLKKCTKVVIKPDRWSRPRPKRYAWIRLWVTIQRLKPLDQKGKVKRQRQAREKLLLPIHTRFCFD